MTDSLYAPPHGFFVREAPGAHFRTSVHVSPLFARAVTRLLLRLDEALDRPRELTLLDVGAGRGELLAQVAEAVAEDDPHGLARRLRRVAVELAPRPDGLDPGIVWQDVLPPPGSVTGLLFANEWLDNVPLDVVEADDAGVVRYVLVDREGRESAGEPVAGEDAAWLRRWWPLDAEPGLRAEVGLPRDVAWTAAVRTLRRGLAVAVDYAHTRAARPPLGTLTGYLDGREVPPAPDGARDLTAHVAVDACAAAAGGPWRTLTQREALHDLGVHGGRPPLSWASTDALAYVRGLRDASQAAELTDLAGLGAFTWLTRPVDAPDLFGAPAQTHAVAGPDG
ncbi:SAM-dependent methyltransferase [Streptomyces sp. DSM 42041]|uniref:SAM-dependent methyltransferase n=1 Tax=Streptomyces hazeniae TaxID=3075538 RepID=A0ABU2P002_9ACTN|nr:SAM-dependent methyltransferase [Streptomyces sp. DSM 42041]MDT0381803.1 SAM-dependent methyltransferase [Streptomyces sp. DSM 42041]